MSETEAIEAATEKARRESRYRFARERIRRIVDASPPLTDEQIQVLAEILRPAVAKLEREREAAAIDWCTKGQPS